jgi:hypothetical protein
MIVQIYSKKSKSIFVNTFLLRFNSLSYSGRYTNSYVLFLKKLLDSESDKQYPVVQKVNSYRKIHYSTDVTDNGNYYYLCEKPDINISLNMIIADSPMKGHISATDVIKLTFQYVTIDAAKQSMTIRECRRDSLSGTPSSPIFIGEKQ